MSNMGHTEVVNLVRAAPRVVDLVVGRVLEAPKPPVEAHLLPDICFKGHQKPLGKKQSSSITINFLSMSEHVDMVKIFSSVSSFFTSLTCTDAHTGYIIVICLFLFSYLSGLEAYITSEAALNIHPAFCFQSKLISDVFK